jgi:hypothetical protein
LRSPLLSIISKYSIPDEKHDFTMCIVNDDIWLLRRVLNNPKACEIVLQSVSIVFEQFNLEGVTVLISRHFIGDLKYP